MSANFQPEVYPYKETGSFRFWCQKVLPLVYDDSLSYYELLCKVVKYLNDVIANVDGLHDDVLSTNEAFADLQNYVNDYFDDLNVQEEINTKLDAMAVDGTLSELISPFVSAEIGDVVASQIGDTVASQIGDTVASQIGDVVAEQIGTPTANAVTAWLNEYVDPVGSAVVVDSSLSVEGAAADAKTTGEMIGVITSLTSGYDLNNATTRGFYLLAFSGTFVNSPLSSDANIHKILEVFVRGTNIYQRFSAYKHSSPADYQEFFRLYDGSQWRAWQRGIGASDFASMVSGFPTLVSNMWVTSKVTSGSDLDDVTDKGFYRLPYGGTFTNSPISAEEEANKFKFLEVLSGEAQVYQRYTLYKHSSPTKYVQYIRIYDGGSWKTWTKGFDSAEIDVAYNFAINNEAPTESFVSNSVSSQSANSGINLRVASYNVANYNNDSETYISDTKLLNLRKVLNDIDADIFCTQEDREYIDSGNTKSNRNYIYYPKYPYNAGLGGNTVKVKRSVTDDYVLRLSGQRSMRACLLTIGDVKLLIASTHPVANYNNTGRDSAESITERAVEYQQIFEWCNGEISLNKVDGSGAVYAPTHTHCIIGADMNTCTDTDKSNLATLASANDFILGNGGYIGWFITNPRHQFSIDNIIVTENVVINRIESLYSKYNELYSDHVPVVADVTLI